MQRTASTHAPIYVPKAPYMFIQKDGHGLRARCSACGLPCVQLALQLRDNPRQTVVAKSRQAQSICERLHAGEQVYHLLQSASSVSQHVPRRQDCRGRHDQWPPSPGRTYTTSGYLFSPERPHLRPRVLSRSRCAPVSAQHSIV